MKPLLLQVGEDESSSFDIRHEKVAYFDNPWHYHPELELNLVTKSFGIKFIGDSIEPFKPGDLVLLGRNLPHYWRNSERYYNEVGQINAEAIIMRFRNDLWGTELLKSPEMRAVNALLHQAELGIQFHSRTSEQIEPLLQQTLKSQGMAKIILWFKIFEILSEAKDYRFLSQKSFSGLNPREDSSRIATILAYVQNHLSEKINLSDVASMANMNRTAFCRYFKQKTNKTFIDLLNELRIQLACRQLIETSKDISQIAYDCGSEDVSYFNQVFKAKTLVNPTAFRLTNNLNS
jgi:AraC-like DNA-binding protein